MKKYVSIFIILLLAIPALAQVDTLHHKGWRKDSLPDGRPWWSNNDTTKFTPTGYIAASGGIMDEAYAFRDPSLSISAIIPINHSAFGIAGKLGYNSLWETGSTSNFLQYYLVVGGFFTFQLNTRYAFDVRLMGGLAYCHYPEQNYTLSTDYDNYINRDSVVNYTFNVTPSNALSFMFEGDIGFRYRISKKLGVLLNIDYMLIRPVFNATLTTSNISYTVIHYSAGNPSVPITKDTYNFPPNSTSQAYAFEAAPMNGYTMFSLGIFYQLGKASLIK